MVATGSRWAAGEDITSGLLTDRAGTTEARRVRQLLPMTFRDYPAATRPDLGRPDVVHPADLQSSATRESLDPLRFVVDAYDLAWQDYLTCGGLLMALTDTPQFCSFNFPHLCGSADPGGLLPRMRSLTSTTSEGGWWRTLPDNLTVEQAQASLDEFCRLRTDTRLRPTSDGKASVATVAAAEPLTPAPATPFPATLAVERRVSAQALGSFRGNSYNDRPITAWGDILGDTTVAAALLDRLLHRSVVLDISGDSYRLRDHHARTGTRRNA